MSSDLLYEFDAFGGHIVVKHVPETVWVTIVLLPDEVDVEFVELLVVLVTVPS